MHMVIASVTASLAPLVVLACPVGMGAMMWVMARSSRRQKDREQTPRASARPPSLELLREEHDRLSEEIERLERREAETSRER